MVFGCCKKGEPDEVTRLLDNDDGIVNADENVGVGGAKDISFLGGLSLLVNSLTGPGLFVRVEVEF